MSLEMLLYETTKRNYKKFGSPAKTVEDVYIEDMYRNN